MFTLAATETLQCIAGTTNVIALTVYGMQKSAGVEVNKVLAQQLITNSATTAYTAPSSTEGFIKTIHLANTSSSAVTGVKLFRQGNANANLIFSGTIPANGWATYGEDGWHVYNAESEELINGAGFALGHLYLYSTNTTTNSDPGAGQFRFNASPPSGSVTRMSISKTTQAGMDISTVLNFMLGGVSTIKGLFTISHPTMSQVITVQVNSIVSDNSGWYELNATVLANTIASLNDQDQFYILPDKSNDGSIFAKNGGGLLRANYTADTSSTTDSDPGVGKFRWSAADDGVKQTATLYISTRDNNGVDFSEYFDSFSFDAYSSPTLSVFSAVATLTKRFGGRIVSRTTATNYRKLTIEFFYRAPTSPIFANNDVLTFQFNGAGLAIPELPSFAGFSAGDQRAVAIPSFMVNRAIAFTPTASRAYIVPFHTRVPLWVRFLTWMISTGATAGTGTMRALLYKQTVRSANGFERSGAIVHDSGVLTNNLATTGTKVTAVDQMLPPGMYFMLLAFSTFSGSPVLQALNGAYVEHGNLVVPSGVTSWSVATAMWFAADYTASPPNPITAAAAYSSAALNNAGFSDQFSAPIAMVYEPAA